jgi:hypothetical protein
MAALLTGCSGPTATTVEKKAPEKPEPVTGQSALWKMYQVARTWAPDAQVLKMGSIPMPQVDAVPGKAGAWEATFVSATKSKSRSWTFSVIEGEGNLHKGVFAGLEEGWTGARGQQEPFVAIAVKKDTDEALTIARTKSAEYDKKNPNKPISFLLEKTKKFPDPYWRVIWGESLGTSSFSVVVDASTGDYKETLH